MKTSLILTAAIACLGLAVASTFAQTQSTTSSTTTYIQASKIVGKKVKSSQGEEIGTVKDVMLDRNTGCMAYTVLSTGGTGARGGKMVAVPWGVYSPTSNVSELTVTVDRERIYNAPAFDYARIEEYSRPEYITNVNSYYGVSPGAAVGGGVSGSTTTTGTTTTGAGTTSGTTTTGAGTTAGTTASPAGTSSPAATSSPSGAKSPLATTSASPGRSPSPHAPAATTPHPTRGGRPHETVSPSTRGGATGTSPTEEKRGTRGTHEETTPPSGGSETGVRSETQRPTSETQRAPSEATSPSEKATGSQHRQKGKHETTSPSEKPPGGE